MIRIIKAVVFLLAITLVIFAGYRAVNYKFDTLKAIPVMVLLDRLYL